MMYDIEKMAVAITTKLSGDIFLIAYIQDVTYRIIVK